ncbi:hypothetical protein F4775DRAFT_565266 [Biscogniauxia sp. FL1348]|nr:hypothetical protein F4775DRAFT_565266 [Biscogniauxia sp. FL1348]
MAEQHLSYPRPYFYGAQQYLYSPPGQQFSQNPSTPAAMLYTQTGRDHWSVTTLDRGQTLYTIRYSCHSLGITLFRGTDAGPVIGTAKFHSFTTSRVDVEFQGREFRFKKEFVSGTGLGNAEWKHQGHDLIVRDSSGRLVASFLLDGPVHTSHRREGRLEVAIHGLRAEQLEEILMTGLAELERIRRDTEALAIGVRAGIHAG